MRILGSEKVATAEDVQHLPFIRGLVKETLRYMPHRFGENIWGNMPTWQSFIFIFIDMFYLSSN